MLPVSSGIFRSAQPKSEIEFNFLAFQSIKTIIDLENEAGEATWEAGMCEGAGIVFKIVPLSAYVPPSEQDVKTVLDYMNDPANHPILIHCAHGQDRTGLLVGMYRRQFENVDKWTAWSEMLEHGYHQILIGLSWYFWSH
jgi:tyrosine-protein phosphatase SIW14